LPGNCWRNNSARRRERLRRHFDLSTDQVARLHGPVGIPIGSRTPPEIAVSILAAMTAAKYGITFRKLEESLRPGSTPETAGDVGPSCPSTG